MNSDFQLYQFQKEDVLQIEALDGRALLAEEMGLGKSVISLYSLDRNPDWLPALVVAPAGLKLNWQYEARTKFGMTSSVCDGQIPTARYNGFSKDADLTIINYDILRFWTDDLRGRFRTIIFDEGQYMKNPRAKRTKAARELARSVDQVLVLSGTPLVNRPKELWSILNILWPSKYPNFYPFAQQYCAPRLTRFGWNYDGASNLGSLHAELTNIGMIRRRKEDVLKDLPDKVRNVIPLELSNYDEYKEASDDFMNWMKRNHSKKAKSAIKAQELVKIGYLLRLAAKLKLRNVIAWVNRFFEETGEKLVLFVHHKKATKALIGRSILTGKERIPYKKVVVDGSVTGKKRFLAVEQFQNDRNTRLFIGNIQAAGVGITLTAASTVAFAELYWRPGDLLQAEDRCHRIGQENHVTVNYLIAADTIEERLCRLIQSKQKVITSILDGANTEQNLSLYDELVHGIMEERKGKRFNE